MTNSADSLEGFVNVMRTALKTWPQLLPFRQLMPIERPSRNFVAPVFISMVIHVSLAYLLWVMVIDRKSVEPMPPIIDKPLILSLSTFTEDSHDGMDIEVVSEAPHTDPPARRSQSTERKFEAETVVTSKDQDVPDSKAPEDKQYTIDAAPSFELEAAYNMKWDFGLKPVFDESFETSKDQGSQGSETHRNRSLTACLTPSFSLEDFYCIEQEFGKMSGAEIMDMKIKPRMIYIKNYIAETRAQHPDCRTAYVNRGLLMVPYMLTDAIAGHACKWYPEIKEIK